MAANRPLAAGFPQVGEEDWRRLVERSIGDRTYADLIARSDDGLGIGPIYARSAEAGILAGTRQGRWTIVQRIDHPDWEMAGRQVGEDLAGGAGAIELVFETSPNARGTGLPVPKDGGIQRFLAVFAGQKLRLRIDAGEASAAIGTGMLATAEAGQLIDLTPVFDPVTTLAATGRLSRPIGEIADEMQVGAARDGFRTPLTADGRPWNAAGATEIQELAAVTAAFVANWRMLTKRGIPTATAAGMIGVVLAADADQFLTIAKFRAARQVIGHAIAQAVDGPVRVPIHAETAWRMMSRRSAHTNILRTTTAAFAAAVGGADSITVLPFSAAGGLADAFARRVARNSQTILIEEANLARVADPAAGSGAVEALTAELAKKAWEKFRAIEAAGGLLAVVRDGSLRREIVAARAERERRLAAGETVLVGTTLYPETTEGAAIATRPDAKAPTAAGESVEPLVAARLSEPFET